MRFSINMPILVDAHSDIAWNMIKYGRDYTRSAAESRRLEAGSAVVLENEDTMLGWPDFQRGQVALIFATLYATPVRWHKEGNDLLVYKTFDQAREQYRRQLSLYRQMADSMPDKFRLATSVSELNQILEHWSQPDNGEGHPVGLVPLMEGAEAIRELSELEEWRELGLRIIGPAWVATRYSGGWREPGPLTDEGRKLLSAMADYNFILDLSHMDEKAALEALDLYRGPIISTHANCRALLPEDDSNRHLSDRVIEGLIERGGVAGIVPHNPYLKPGWKSGRDRREEVPLRVVAEHLDHICQIAGDSLHAGLGCDFDGSFGVQSVPPELDTIADLQKLSPLLAERGYSQTDIENILGGNWIACLKRELPQ